MDQPSHKNAGLIYVYPDEKQNLYAERSDAKTAPEFEHQDIAGSLHQFGDDRVHNDSSD